MKPIQSQLLNTSLRIKETWKKNHIEKDNKIVLNRNPYQTTL